MRATSSIRSASRCTSASRKPGHADVHLVGRRLARRSRAGARIAADSVDRDLLAEQLLDARGAQRHTSAAATGFGYTSIVPGTIRAPQSSTIRRAASRWAAIAWSGWSCFSNRALASERSPSRFEVSRMFGPTHVAISIRTRVVLLGDLGDLAAHDPGDAARPLGVADHGHVRVELALDAVEGRHLLPRLRAPHDDPVAAHLVEVEGVDRLAGQQHHVVRDVDDVRDRALAGRREALLQPQR